MARPRGFCEEEALDKALDLFWRHGYEGASIAALTEAMGINRPSLYATFGNKEELFKKALDRYVSIKDAIFDEGLAEPTGRDVVRHLLRKAAEMMTEPGHPVGCLAVQGAISCSDESEPVRQELIRIRQHHEQRIRDRFAEEQDAGRLPPGTNPDDLAMLLATIANGMSIQASTGATRAQLLTVAENAARAWPQVDDVASDAAASNAAE
ncbi:MAG: TetR/AcrR family transcriptional regulator [Rhodospirillales bacterium]|nr:TetR/AcrR family transcriptional regulator [Rhodospirillales bacterium]